MFSKLREPFGTAGLVVAVIALVFALGGGAWALSGSLSGKQHLKASGKQHFKAKRHARGIRGPQGPVGPEGPEGPPGVNGADGVNGKPGVNGTDGTPGRSVVSGEEPVGENCAEGGYWFEIQGSGSRQYVCNGGGGAGGGGQTLAPGETVKGLWNFQVQITPSRTTRMTINFPLLIEPAPNPVYVPPGGSAEHCPGNVGNPQADRNYLCIYANVTVATEGAPFLDVIKPWGWQGTWGLEEGEEAAFGNGSWAATRRCPLDEHGLEIPC